MAEILWPAMLPLLDGNADLINNGYLYYFDEDGVTPKNTFSDSALTVANPHPIRTNAAGRPYDGNSTEIAIWGSGLYKLVVHDAADALIISRNPYIASGSFLLSGTGPVARTVSDKLADIVSVADFGVLPSSSDIAAALQLAADWSAANNGAPLFLPNGTYIHKGTTIFGKGTMLWSGGSQGSNQADGAVIIHDVNTVDCLVWDGSEADFHGTGGGMQGGFLVLKQNGRTGGRAICLLATTQDQRPGEMMFQNVLAFGIGTGLWTRGFEIDGTAATTSGSKGVRSVVMVKCRFADVNTANETIKIGQGVHFRGYAVQCDQSHGSAPGVLINGDCENIFFTDSVLGNVTIDGNAVNIILNGSRVNDLTINDTSATGLSSGMIFGTLLNKSPTFKIMGPQAPEFFAYNATTVPDKTGDSTPYTVIPDTQVRDQGGQYDPVTGIFTAQCAGKYRFDAQVLLAGLLVGHDRSDIYLLRKNSGGAEQERFNRIDNPGAIKSVNNSVAIAIGGTMLCNYQDTVELVIDVQGSTKVIDVSGASTARETRFEGRLI